MRYRIGLALVGLALALSTSAAALAQADDDTSTSDGTAAVDAAVVTPVADSAAPPTLFLQLADPAEQDIEVPLGTAQLTVTGTTLPGAVVSVGGDLADVDDQGTFTDTAALDEGANEIDIIASDNQGNQLTTTLYVVRGE
jgi:glucodextranase-like protein